MTDKDEVIFMSAGNNTDKRSFAQRFRERWVYSFQKKRFYAQWVNGLHSNEILGDFVGPL